MKRQVVQVNREQWNQRWKSKRVSYAICSWSVVSVFLVWQMFLGKTATLWAQKTLRRFKVSSNSSSSKHIPRRSQSLWHISRAWQQKKGKTTRKKEQQKARKVKKHTTPCQKKNVVGSGPGLQMKPPPGEELVFRRKRSFIRTEKVSPGSSEPPHSRRISWQKKFYWLTSKLWLPQEPPGSPPGIWIFGKSCSNSPLPGSKSCSNAPTLGKIRRLLF